MEDLYYYNCFFLIKLLLFILTNFETAVREERVGRRRGASSCLCDVTATAPQRRGGLQQFLLSSSQVPTLTLIEGGSRRRRLRRLDNETFREC